MSNEEVIKAALIKRYGEVKPTSSGWYRIPCPTCEKKDRRKCKRYVSPQYFTSNCFICNVKLSRDELLGDMGNIILTSEKPVIIEKPENPNARILPGYRFIPVDKLPTDHPAIAFLAKDHLTDLKRYAEIHKIVYCPSDAGKQFASRPFISSADRLIFPVYFKGEMVGWQMRSIPGTVYGDMADVVRYYHLFNKGKYLYNYDQAIGYKSVILVEGVKKALKLPNAVASLGKNLSAQQIQLLHGWRDIIILLDADSPAQQIGKSLEAGLRSCGKRALNIDLEKHNLHSPDEATSDQLSYIICKEWSETMPLFEMK